MCGLTGIFDFHSNDDLDRKEILLMNRALRHRGPDEEGVYLKGPVALGSRRLSIIDLKGGVQPIHNEDKTLWITFNGEIYNFQELKVSLQKKGHRFYTRTDTECILHLYEEEGVDFVKKLDGMFALVIWDEKKKELLLARDPMGKKPLYWSIVGKRFVFASELKAILTLSSFKKKIDKNSLAKYFFYGYVPSPNTIFEGINRLSSGCFMQVKKSGIEKERKYWEIDYLKKVDLSLEEIKKETLLLLKKAVEKRLISDVPIGVLLSGGIDSSLIAALMPSKKVEAFTIGFEDSRFDESIYAKMIADHLGIKQNIKIFSNREIFRILPKALELMDEPMADPSLLPTYLLASFTSQKVKVALSGDGGDESFAGYPKYLAHFFLHETGLEKFPLRSADSAGQQGKIGKLLAHYSQPLYLRNQLWISSLSSEEIKEMTGTSLRLDELENYHMIFNGKDVLDEAFFLDQKMTLADQNLVKVDRASMANSLEVRCPFLDKALVEFSAKLPYKSKIGRFKTKYLLREIAKDLLPPEIINLPKRGFGIPLKEWLNNELQPLKEESLSLKKIKKEGILDPEVVERILKRNNNDAIWKLLVFEIWADKWLR